MALTWTQADVDALKASIASGILSVTYAGPPSRSITYRSLAEMRSVLAEANAAVSGSPRYRLVGTSKGLGR